MVPVAAAASLLDDVARLNKVGDDAEDGALGDAQGSGEGSQPSVGVAGDVQQHPTVVGDAVLLSVYYLTGKIPVEMRNTMGAASLRLIPSTEDDGVLLTVVLDACTETSYLLLLDARDLAEIARARVAQHVPFGFHGTYVQTEPADQ